MQQLLQNSLGTHHPSSRQDRSLESSRQPIGVSEYRLNRELPEEYAEFLPSPEDLRARI